MTAWRTSFLSRPVQFVFFTHMMSSLSKGPSGGSCTCERSFCSLCNSILWSPVYVAGSTLPPSSTSYFSSTLETPISPQGICIAWVSTVTSSSLVSATCESSLSSSSIEEVRDSHSSSPAILAQRNSSPIPTPLGSAKFVYGDPYRIKIITHIEPEITAAAPGTRMAS
jgi:hypothetical protein